MSRITLTSVATVALLASVHGAAAQTEIQWWHAMGGNLGEVVNELAAGFNKSQSEYKVNPVFKGSYTETLTAAIAASAPSRRRTSCRSSRSAPPT